METSILEITINGLTRHLFWLMVSMLNQCFKGFKGDVMISVKANLDLSEVNMKGELDPKNQVDLQGS